MDSVIKTLRWILFIPAGFIASMIFGVMHSIFTKYFLELSDWLSDFMSGGITALLFIIAATFVSPQEFSSTKMSVTDWIILVTISLYGISVGISSFYVYSGLIDSIFGFTMAFVTIIFYTVIKKQIPEDTFTVNP